MKRKSSIWLNVFLLVIIIGFIVIKDTPIFTNNSNNVEIIKEVSFKNIGTLLSYIALTIMK